MNVFIYKMAINDNQWNAYILLVDKLECLTKNRLILKIL